MKKAETMAAIERLREMLPEGAEVYTILRHVSRSGMYRAIDLYVIKDNKPWRITWDASQALAWRYDKRHDAMGVGGCGMDMGFHAICTLARVLFGSTAGKDGGYALTQRWL